jgi:putative NAD(P)-binding protein
MIDWFLRVHGVAGAPLCFDMGGLWSTVSIRDQMLRAQELVRRLKRAGALSSMRPLLVIGAGAAGVTAALEAERRGIAARVIDSAPSPFGRQARCHTRWVDPTQYDWPMPHWSSGRFPWLRARGGQVTRVSLPWPAAPAAHLAVRWNAGLLAAIARRAVTAGYNTQLVNVALLPPGPATPMTQVEAETQEAGQPSSKNPYGAILGATGMGQERTSLGAFRAWQFWDNDTLEAPNCGLPLRTGARVLISGAGDGALQDFLRAATGLASAKDLWNQLIAAGASASPDFLLDLLAAEDQLKCAYACADGSDDHDLLQEIHDCTRAAASQWYAFNRHVLTSALRRLLRQRPDVALLHPCSHFNKAYLLNRFLVHVLAEHLHVERGHTAIHDRLTVQSVVGVGHPCSSPMTCLGHDHEVEIVDGPRCDAPPGATVVHRWHFNVVVLRHGIIVPAPLFRSPAAGPFRHPLPQYPQP